MSTRSATIIRQTTYYSETDVNTEELMRFYRHCDGYPECHGIDMAKSIIASDCCKVDHRAWAQEFLARFLAMPMTVEFEPKGCQHGDLEYLYVVEGIVDYRWGKTKSGKLPVTISVYGMGWDEDYGVAMERTPIFSGTAYEYMERFGRKAD